MLTLHHWTLDPLCRQVRLAMKEKKLEFELKDETPWNPRPEFLHMDPGGLGPVLAPDGAAAPIVGVRALMEYVEETNPEPALLPADPRARAEVRRLMDWFDTKFAAEAGAPLMREKIVKRMAGLGSPDMEALRGGRDRLRWHLDYVSWLTEQRDWLAGEEMTLADFTAAAHLSAIDYLGEVPWDEYSHAKDWYAKVKSRPCFRPVLADRLPGLPPPSHYDDLDF